MVTALTLFFLLLVGHAIGDRPLQPPWLSRLKRDKDREVAIGALLIHGVVHGLSVAIITESGLLAIAEVFCHAGIDYLKTQGWYKIKTDQLLHVVCKMLWVAAITCWPHLP